MDKYIEILQEPNHNLMINQKETLCLRSQFQKKLYSFDNYLWQTWRLPRIYKQEYTKKSYNKQNTFNKSV